MAHQDPQLEKWLDSALMEYGSAEPRPGLEKRVLARLRSEEHATHWRWSWPTVGFATAVAIMIGVVLIHRSADIPLPPPARIAGAPPLGTTYSAQGRMIPHVRKPRNVENITGNQAASNHEEARSTPRRDEFPSPAPLSEEELMLARYVREHYESAVLMARAEAEMLRQDALEKSQPANDAGPSFQNPKEEER